MKPEEALKIPNHPLTSILYFLLQRKSLSWESTRFLMRINYRLNRRKLDLLAKRAA